MDGDRDERFARIYSKLYADFVVALLWLPERLLRRMLYGVHANFACGTAEPLGRVVGTIYVSVRDAGDVFRWLATGKTR